MKIRPVTTIGALGALTVVLCAAAASGSALPPASPGDFNGDGHRDVALGSPLGLVGTVPAGFVTVVYGGSTGPDTAHKEVISQDSAGVPGSATANSAFGAALASADFDRDGYADLAISAPGENAGEFTHAGAVTIVYGSAAGLSSRTTRLTPDATHQDTNGRFGESLAAADLTSDGVPDLAVTAGSDRSFWVFSGLRTGDTEGTREPLDDENYAGGLTLTAADFTGDGRTDVAAGWVEESDGVPIARTDLYGGTGSGVSLLKTNAGHGGPEAAAGDVNGDGRADLISRIQTREGPDVDGGGIAVDLGTSDGFRLQTTITQDTAGVPGTGEEGDQFGATLAVGDLNGDGKADVAVGAPGEDISTVSDAGAFTVLYGGASGVTTAGAQQIGQDTSGVPGGAEAGDAFGTGLAAGDLTGDGRADLIVGAPGENGTEGAVWIFRGSASGASGSGSSAFNPVTLGISGRTAHLGDVILP